MCVFPCVEMSVKMDLYLKKGKGGWDINSPQPIQPPPNTPTHPPTHPHIENTLSRHSEGVFSSPLIWTNICLYPSNFLVIILLIYPTSLQQHLNSPSWLMVFRARVGSLFFWMGVLNFRNCIAGWLLTQCDSLNAWLHSPFPPVTHIVVRTHTQAHTEESFQWNGTGCIYIVAKILKCPGQLLWTNILTSVGMPYPGQGWD